MDLTSEPWDPSALPAGGGRVLRLEVDGLVELVVCQPEVRNALSPGMMAALAQHVDDLLRSPCRGVLLRGEGQKAFCSGGDLRSVRQHLLDKGAGLGMCRTMGRLLDRLHAAPFPVVAAVEGVALGGGAELVGACHVVFAGRSARLGFVHASLGVSPGWGGGRRLRERVGTSRARRILLEARPYATPEALSLGLVDHVCEDGSAREAGLAWLRAVTERPAAAVAAAMHIGRGAEVEDEEAWFGQLWGSPEHRRRLGLALGATTGEASERPSEDAT